MNLEDALPFYGGYPWMKGYIIMKFVSLIVCVSFLFPVTAQIRGISRLRNRISRIETEEQKTKRKAASDAFYQSVSNHLSAAQSGNAAEQFWMAKFCRAFAYELPAERIDEKYDYACRALKWLTKAAEGGHVNAMSSLGQMLIDGGFNENSSRNYFGERFLSLDRMLRKSADDPIVLSPGQMSVAIFPPVFVYESSCSNKVGKAKITYRHLYKQDIARGLEYLKKAAIHGDLSAKQWLDYRKRYALPEGLPTWACATNSMSAPAVGPTFTMTVKTRAYNSDEALAGFYRTITIDTSGKTVGISAEFIDETYYKFKSPWQPPLQGSVLEE